MSNDKEYFKYPEKIRCWAIFKVLDKNKNHKWYAFPEIRETYCLEDRNTIYIVQSSLTNCHQAAIKKECVFFSKKVAVAYLEEHYDELKQECAKLADMWNR